MPTTKSEKKPYTARDLRDVSDNPEWTEQDFKKPKRFSDVFPDLAKSIRRGRGPNKAPTKKLVSLRLSTEVIDHFKAGGAGWQTRIEEALSKIALSKRAKSARSLRSSARNWLARRFIAFSSEVGTGSREENASNRQRVHFLVHGFHETLMRAGDPGAVHLPPPVTFSSQKHSSAEL